MSALQRPPARDDASPPAIDPEEVSTAPLSTRVPAPARPPAVPVSGRRWLRRGVSVAVLALAACSTPGPQGPAPVTTPGATVPAPPGTVPRSTGRWVPADFTELPGWADDALTDWWPAWMRSCAVATGASPWARLCASAARLPSEDDLLLRAWVETNFRVFRVESDRGNPTGLATGYFEPELVATRQPTATFQVPLWAPPADQATRKPGWTRQQLATEPQARAAVQGRELAFVADPLDALLLQIQGSGRLDLIERDGRQRSVRMAFAGHNDQPYKSVGRWLIDQGELRPGEASWAGIKDWARRHPERLDEMLWVNPRMVFFREEPLPDPSIGPRGAQGVPLTPGRSIAVDPTSVPYGTPVWLDTTEPSSSVPLQRLVMAQDTGSAITGAVRADYFWGWGDAALAEAGRMKQSLAMWVLWPRHLPAP